MESLRIRVDELRDRALELNVLEDAALFPPLAALADSGEVVVTAPVSVTIRAQREFDHIRVAAKAETRMRFVCSRCLADFETGVATSFQVFFRKGDPGTPTEEEIELAEEDLVSATYQGEYLELRQEVADQVVMEIPLKPLCSPDCRGLCPVCGADNNLTECGCSRDAGDLRFAVLKNLKLEN